MIDANSDANSDGNGGTIGDPAAILAATSTFLCELGIKEPTVVIDEHRVRANIAAMAGKARAGGVIFRPHFKTHQSATIGEWFGAEGVAAITVSSLAMAEYFVDHGWTDITVAMLVNPLECERIDRLATRIAGLSSTKPGRDDSYQLGVVVDNLASIITLANGVAEKLKVWIKVDTGYGRTGVHWQDHKGLALLARAITEASQLELRGLLTHAGDSYASPGAAALKHLYATTAQRLNSARDALLAADPKIAAGSLVISVGDTPTCSAIDAFDGVDEVRPGNFVFFDLMQLGLGACAESDLAAAVACPVIGCYPERGQLAIHGGAVQLSKEFLTGAGGKPCYGYLGSISAAGLGPVLKGAPLSALSQEHGIVTVAPEIYASYFRELRPGDLVLVYPVHSCLTCDLHNHYLSLGGEVIERRHSR